ncbi:delta-type opioid receptor-like [Acanthaster planci]|uniref:Delta-type opioid receptor-like n=1 Tax=Acanthaster planci TaxID=133434 RepID=A0A8B7XWU2_ACAPL|nr:delta-type opioid receptor-like [Acanthaster planci]
MLRYRTVFSSTTNKLILHQSAVDLVASLVFFVRRVLEVSSPVTDNAAGSLYCKLWWSEWPIYGMFVTSTYNTVAISVERYFAVCHPVKHRNMLSSYCLKSVVLAVWLCGWLPEAHLVPISHHSKNSCDISWPSPTVQAVGGVIILVYELVIPLSVMVFSYSKVILELRKRSNARMRNNNNEAQNMMSKANKNVTKTLIVVAIFFALCWIPNNVNYTLFNLGLHVDSYDGTLTQATGATVLLNMCINPFIYCFAYDRFQKQVRELVSSTCRCRNNQVSILPDPTVRSETVETAA